MITLAINERLSPHFGRHSLTSHQKKTDRRLKIVAGGGCGDWENEAWPPGNKPWPLKERSSMKQVPGVQRVGED